MASEHSSAPDLQPGSQVAGRFEIIRCLGVGSMGIVYLGCDVSQPDELLAIKVLSPSQHIEGSEDVFFERFANEVKACSQVTHTHVVRFKEFVNLKGFVAYTMEYVGGGDLASYLRDQGAIDIPRVISLLNQMALGVGAIHRAGIIHRDLKPANILLTETGEVKIADFGIARGQGTRKITAPGGVVGTIDYLSPQYLENGAVDFQSDIYSLGVLAYQLITGHTPFQGVGFYQSIELKLNSDPRPPHELNEDCPMLLSDLVMRALSRDLSIRHKSAEDLVADLAPLLLAYPIDQRVAPWARKRVTSTGSKIVEIVDIRDFCNPDSSRGEGVISPTVTTSRSSLATEETEPPTQAIVSRRSRRPSPLMIGGLGTLAGMLIVFLFAQRFQPLGHTNVVARMPSIDNVSSTKLSADVEKKVTNEQNISQKSVAVLDTASSQEPSSLGEVQVSKAVVASMVRPVGQELLLKPDFSSPSTVVLGARESAVTERARLRRESQEVSKVERQTAEAGKKSTDASNLNRKSLLKSEHLHETSEPSTPPAQETVASSALISNRTVVEPSTENKVRATLLYRFADYIEWPSSAFASAESAFQVCIVGADPFGNYFDANLSRIQSKITRPFALVRLTYREALSRAPACQLMYISGHESEEVERLAEEVEARKLPVLVVTELPGVGSINFTTQERKVKFEIHNSRVQASGLRVAPLLLDLAITVD